ncbi:type II secretion system F family protein [Acidobacteria bacterium AH-259-D05]|nr:type II secretion system F family protein [Acidobacteria bacterium AH-259-D05]
MAFFRYKAVTPDGKMVEGTLEGVDQETVMARLQEQGQLPVKVFSGEDTGLLSRQIQLPWRRRRVSQNELLVFTQELSTLIEAGLTLDRSLRILSDLTENVYLSEVVAELLREIKSGRSLSQALAMYPQVFPKVYVNMVKAGEVGGALDEILKRLVDFLEDVEELRSYLTTSLIYPSILTLVAGGSIVFMLAFVIPQFAGIFENAGAPIPLPMRLMLGISGILAGYWWILLLIAAGLWYGLKTRLETEQGRISWDRQLLKLPLLGAVFQKIEVSRFSRTMGTLLRSAVPLIQAINIVKEIVGNQAIASTMEAIKSGVKKGEGLAAPIREAQIFPPFALHLLQVGEETGKLDDMLLQIAETYDRELRTALKRLIALFEPAIILVMGLIIGVMVVSIIYSIISINDVPF